MRGQIKIAAVARIPRLAPIALVVFAVGCAPIGSKGPVLNGNTAKQTSSARETLNVRPGGIVVVRKGDSLYKIARRYKVNLRDLIEVNRARPPYYIFAGQRLRLPGQRIHVVAKGETLYGVSRRYGIDMTTLVRINKIAPPYRVAAGRRLRLPGTAYQPSRSARDAARAARAKAPDPKSRARQPSGVALTRLPPRSGRQFLWPVHGRVIVGFGPRAGGLHNDGINILARRGTGVRAAENGLVAYSGNELRGFGNLLLLKHRDGWITAYAHNETLLVKVGQKVKRGQLIARVGATGGVARPQLHFELRRGVRVVDPIRHLQPLRAQAKPVSPIAFLAAPPNPE